MGYVERGKYARTTVATAASNWPRTRQQGRSISSVARSVAFTSSVLSVIGLSFRLSLLMIYCLVYVLCTLLVCEVCLAKFEVLRLAYARWRLGVYLPKTRDYMMYVAKCTAGMRESVYIVPRI